MTDKDVAFMRDIAWKARDAVWQFLIDHSHVMPNGAYRITFFTTGEPNFWQRVSARHSGEFKRYSKLERLTSSRHRSEKKKEAAWALRDATLAFVGANGSLRQRVVSRVLRWCERYLYTTPGALDRLRARGAKFVPQREPDTSETQDTSSSPTQGEPLKSASALDAGTR